MKFNEVTWYSKLAAIIFFIGVLPALTFYIGMSYKEAVMWEGFEHNNVVVPVKMAPKHSSTSIVAADTTDWKTFKDSQGILELKYPPNWEVSSVNKPRGTVIGNGIPSEDYRLESTVIVSFKDPKIKRYEGASTEMMVVVGKSFDDVVDSSKAGYSISTSTSFQIAGKKGTVVTIVGFDAESGVVIENGGKYYMVLFPPKTFQNFGPQEEAIFESIKLLK